MIKDNLDLYKIISRNSGFETKNNIDRDYLSLKHKYNASKSDCRNISQLFVLGYKYDDKYIVPDYQRDLVWTLEQKENLIKSILYGNPIGDFLFKKEFGKDANGNPNELEVIWSIIDGQQRINAIRGFILNEFKIDNKYFKDLKYWDARSFIETEITVITIKEISLKEEIEIYLNRNCGGTNHTKEDLDKAKRFLMEEENENELDR